MRGSWKQWKEAWICYQTMLPLVQLPLLMSSTTLDLHFLTCAVNFSDKMISKATPSL